MSHMFYLRAAIETLPAMDQDELLCIQDQIFLRNLHLPRECTIGMMWHDPKNKGEQK